MTVSQAIATLEAAVPDPSQGLPEEIFRFISRINPLINVDLLIHDHAQRILLTWRHDDWYGPGWHIPGGIIRYKERAADRIVKTARAELKVTVAFDPTPLKVVETFVAGRERGHFISLLHRCSLLGPLPEDLRASIGPPQNGQWRWFETVPENLIAEQKAYTEFFGSRLR